MRMMSRSQPALSQLLWAPSRHHEPAVRRACGWVAPASSRLQRGTVGRLASARARRAGSSGRTTADSKEEAPGRGRARDTRGRKARSAHRRRPAWRHSLTRAASVSRTVLPFQAFRLRDFVSSRDRVRALKENDVDDAGVGRIYLLNSLKRTSRPADISVQYPVYIHRENGALVHGERHGLRSAR